MEMQVFQLPDGQYLRPNYNASVIEVTSYLNQATLYNPVFEHAETVKRVMQRHPKAKWVRVVSTQDSVRVI